MTKQILVYVCAGLLVLAVTNHAFLQGLYPQPPMHTPEACKPEIWINLFIFRLHFTFLESLPTMYLSLSWEAVLWSEGFYHSNSQRPWVPIYLNPFKMLRTWKRMLRLIGAVGQLKSYKRLWRKMTRTRSIQDWNNHRHGIDKL